MLMKMTTLFATVCITGFLTAAVNEPLLAASSTDQRALTELQRMSASLAAAKAFTYRSQTFVEVPSEDGQMLTFLSRASVALQRPDKIRALLTGEAPHFDFYYDGSTVTAFGPANNVYSVAKAPPSIDAMLPALQQETGIRFASSGLLFSNPYKVLTQGLRSAVYVGAVSIDGTPCEHLAFRSKGVNWEIWIESGPRALPRRLAVTYTDRPNFPRTLVQFSDWNLRPWLGARAFVFHPPAGSHEIPFLSVLSPAARP